MKWTSSLTPELCCQDFIKAVAQYVLTSGKHCAQTPSYEVDKQQQGREHIRYSSRLGGRWRFAAIGSSCSDLAKSDAASCKD